MQVNLIVLHELLVRSRTTLKSPEIILILLTCPLLQENAMKEVLELAVVIAELNDGTLKLLSTQRKTEKTNLLHKMTAVALIAFIKLVQPVF